MKVLTYDAVLNCLKERELEIGDSPIKNYISGMTLQSAGSSSLKINRGCIYIQGSYHTLSSYKVIPISSMPFIEGSNIGPISGIYWVYVKNKNGGELTQEDFYLSYKAPTADCYGKTVSLNILNPNESRYPYDFPEYRCIGAIYAKNISNGEILEFDMAFLGYWESKWTSFDEAEFSANSFNKLKHGLGLIPKFWELYFKPDLHLEAVTFQNYHIRGGWWQSSYGCCLGGFMDRESLEIRAGRRVYYYDYGNYHGWFNDGYLKLIVRAF